MTVFSRLIEVGVRPVNHHAGGTKPDLDTDRLELSNKSFCFGNAVRIHVEDIADYDHETSSTARF